MSELVLAGLVVALLYALTPSGVIAGTLRYFRIITVDLEAARAGVRRV